MKDPIKKLIKQAATQVDRERDRFAGSLGITGVQMSVIDFLANQKKNAAAQRDIEHEFDIQRSTTTVMLQRMEKNHLVERVVDPRDKRKKKVKLTEKAIALVKEIKQYMKKDDQQVLSHFSGSEIEAAKKVLNLIKKGEANGQN